MAPRFDRKVVLEQFAGLAPDEDTSLDVARVFLPLPVHRLALRPDVVVIQGTRGAGKTALFRVVHELGPRVRDFFEDPAIPSAAWIDAYAETGTEHPAASSLDALAERVGEGGDGPLRAFWAVHLLVRLKESGVGSACLPPAVDAAYQRAPGDPCAWIDAAASAVGAIVASLDVVERSLVAEGNMVFASYDHLDRIGVLAPRQSARRRLVRALLALWLSNAGRYRHLRAKVFLRPDLFEEAEASFPDASKLRPRSVLLSWDVASMYRLSVRHLVNRGPHADAALAWLSSARIRVKEMNGFGLLPPAMDLDEQRAFAEALAGETMGSGSRKGFTYRWIPARLRDAGGSIVPRSFLRLLRNAAEATLLAGVPASGPLMEPMRLVGALQKTSIDRTAELIEEYPLVRRLQNLRGGILLMQAGDVREALSKMPADNDGYGTDGSTVFDELRRIGVIDIRDDGRVDVPDIYRYGFGIKRRGGSKAPR